MIELWEGIHTYFSANAGTAAFRALLTGDLWNVEAKPGTAFPYATFDLITDMPDNFASGKNFIENCLIQFNIFSDKKSAEELLTIYDALIACFDFTNITVSNYTVSSCVREAAVKLKEDNIWQMNIRYRIKLEPSED